MKQMKLMICAIVLAIGLGAFTPVTQTTGDYQYKIDGLGNWIPWQGDPCTPGEFDVCEVSTPDGMQRIFHLNGTPVTRNF